MELAKQYENMLREEGYTPSIDDDGDVCFKYEGRSYHISVDEDDSTYFKLVFISRWGSYSESETEDLLKATAEVARQMKATKARIAKEDIFVITSEQFIVDVSHAKSIFKRMLNCVSGGLDVLKEEMTTMAKA